MSVPLFTLNGFIPAGISLLMTGTDALLRKLRREHQFALPVPDSTFLSRPERRWDGEQEVHYLRRSPVRLKPTGKVLASALRWIVGESLGGKGNALLWPVDRWKFSAIGAMM